MNTIQDDMDFLIKRMKEVHAEKPDREEARIGKKIKLANLVLDDAIAEGCFDDFEAGTNRQIEMARVLNERLADLMIRVVMRFQNLNNHKEDLLDIVTHYLEDCDDEERLLGEELWEAAEKALENNETNRSHGHFPPERSPQDEATEEWQEPWRRR